MNIRPCTSKDFQSVYELINTAAAIYKQVIPPDCWSEPYMPRKELREEIESGVQFYGEEAQDVLRGIMGIQRVREVALIRHAYVLPKYQRQGIGSKLLKFLRNKTTAPLLVGTWAGAEWAIRFYKGHGFQLVDSQLKDRLLQTYWTVPDRQRLASVVLADQRWIYQQA